MVRLEYISANVPEGMRAINAAGIGIAQAEQVDDLTLHFSVRRSDLRQLRSIVSRRGEELKVQRSLGLYWLIKRSVKRPVLVGGMLLILGLTVYLPSRILFIEVEGNASIPARQIVENAAEHGIGFWSPRREVRSEKVKNALLESVPGLQWAGINTYGCRAVISVRERTEPEKTEPNTGVSSIVASQDGVIREMTVVQGSPVCKVGQSVKEGQVLVSGYSDLGICIRATHAEGEIFAETSRSLSAGIPSEWLQRAKEGRQEKKYSLIIGKKRINFDEGSGISPTTCGKMYEEYYLTLPGGFELPVALTVERWTYHDMSFSTMDEEQAVQRLSTFAKKHLTEHMIAGRIDAQYETFASSTGYYCLTGRYACYEMIGKSRPEEILDNETDRTDSERRTSGGSDLGLRLLR